MSQGLRLFYMYDLTEGANVIFYIPASSPDDGSDYIPNDGIVELDGELLGEERQRSWNSNLERARRYSRLRCSYSKAHGRFLGNVGMVLEKRLAGFEELRRQRELGKG